MTTSAVQKKLDSAKSGITEYSYTIQRKQSFEDLTNQFLEKLWDVKLEFEETSKNILSIVSVLETVTWLTDRPSEKILKEINSILNLTRGLYSNLEKRKSLIKKLKISEMCPEASQLLFDDIDLLGETIDDLEAIYFRLPKNPDFKEICNRASLL